MKVVCCLVFGLSPVALAFSSQTQTPSRLDLRIFERRIKKSPSSRRQKRQSCDPCQQQEPESSDADILSLLDRREAAFAMLGAVWASTTTVYSIPAYAASGDEARLSLPNPLQGLVDRSSKQCLVESLGNRECLVYMDDSDAMLYKGADYKLLMTRIETAYVVLKDQLPGLIDNKKWSQVSGVLTGPLGELIKTMNQMTKLVDAGKVASCERKVQAVKKDLYAISAAVGKKDVAKAMSAYESAVKELASFIVDFS